MQSSLLRSNASLDQLERAAKESGPVSGLTHKHYKYPARFSPSFVAAAVDAFSDPGDLILDPYVGGGTTVVEAMSARRSVVGCDINSLALFVTRVKSTSLTEREVVEISRWAEAVVPNLSYRHCPDDLADFVCEKRTRNLGLPRARALKKLIALAIMSIEELSNTRTQEFARCALLNVGQWALNGRRKSVTTSEFRDRLTITTFSMLSATVGFSARSAGTTSTLIHDTAENLPADAFFKGGAKADLVITSPPYPGIHILYHRWQVDGRRETPAPYWIADCLDGEGASYYNFGGRKQLSLNDYFASSLRTLNGIRRVLRTGAVMVQMIAFSNQELQLPRYLRNMRDAGFREYKSSCGANVRFWRDVPGRSWHANLKGKTQSSKELVLIHVAE